MYSCAMMSGWGMAKEGFSLFAIELVDGVLNDLLLP